MYINQIFNKVNFGFLLLVIALIAGETIRIPIFGSVKINLADLLVICFLAINLKNIKISHQIIASELRIYGLASIILFFTMIFTLLIRVSDVPLNQILQAVLYPLRWLFYIATFFILHRMHHNDSQQRLTILKCSIVLASLLGLVQLVLFPSLKNIEILGFDPHYQRTVSTWLDPNYFGIFLAFGFALFYTYPFKSNITQYTSLLIIIFSFITTYSRSAYLTFFITMISLSILQKSLKTFFTTMAIITIAITIMFLPRASLEKSRNIDRAVSADLRLSSYHHAVSLYLEKPIFGVGYNLIRYEKLNHKWVQDMQNGGNSGAGFDSSFLVIASSMGIVGLGVYLGYLVALFNYLTKGLILNRKPIRHQINQIFQKNAQCTQLGIAITLGWLTSAFLVNSLFYSLLFLFWLIVIATIYSCSKD
ncbi:MAG: O-antigen ligase family protein [bacterium]|nr:O-antigen ligase family protein [bacterium]